MRLEEKITLLKQLYQMSKVDNEISDKEFNFLLDLSVSLEIPFEIISDIFEEKSIHLKESIPINTFERIIQIYRLALMMNIDKHVKFEEVNLLKNIAIELKLPSEPVDNLLKSIINSPDGILQPEEIIEIFNITGN